MKRMEIMRRMEMDEEDGGDEMMVMNGGGWRWIKRDGDGWFRVKVRVRVRF